MDPFEGIGFEHLTRYKCTIVGPRCLITCLQKGEPVPDLPYPMYTASFRNLIVTSTGFSKDQKNDLQVKVIMNDLINLKTFTDIKVNID